MKKPMLNFGQFTQYDKVFITADNGIDLEKVTSVAFEGETLYIAEGDSLGIYVDGKIKKIQAEVSKLFTRNGKLYASVGNSLAEIKNGKIKKLADFANPVIDISVALDKSVWLITESELFLMNGDEFEKIVDLPEETVCLAALNNKSKYGETVYVYPPDPSGR